MTTRWPGSRTAPRNPGLKNGARRREFYEDRGARISIMAGGSASRPDTLKQTDQLLISKTLLQTGRAIRFEKPLGRPRRPRDGADEPKAGDSRATAKIRPTERSCSSTPKRRFRSSRKVDAPPPHDAMHGRGRGRLQQVSPAPSSYASVSFGWAPGGARLRGPAKPVLIVAMNPVAQRPPIHAARVRRGRPVGPFQHQGQGQHPPRRRSSPCPPPLEAQTRSNPTA